MKRTIVCLLQLRDCIHVQNPETIQDTKEHIVSYGRYIVFNTRGIKRFCRMMLHTLCIGTNE